MTLPKQLCRDLEIRAGTVLIVTLAKGDVIKVQKTPIGKEAKGERERSKESF